MVQTNTEAYRASGISPWDRGPGRDVDHSRPPRRRATPLPTTYINGADKDNFTSLFTSAEYEQTDSEEQ
jgi:hypothetical protein